MARRVYFIFDYQRDLWRVNQICNIPNIIPCAVAGFQDAPLWEEAIGKGEAAIKRLVDNGLENTSVSVVCIGSMTYYRPYVNYEIRKSQQRLNGILGIFINHLKDHNQSTSERGLAPTFLGGNYKFGHGGIHDYTNESDLAEWIEVAATRAERYK